MFLQLNGKCFLVIGLGKFYLGGTADVLLLSERGTCYRVPSDIQAPVSPMMVRSWETKTQTRGRTPLLYIREFIWLDL